jgi:ribosomal protein L30E
VVGRVSERVAGNYVFGVKVTVSLVSVRSIKIVIAAYSWFLYFTLPTLMMYGQTQIKFTLCDV